MELAIGHNELIVESEPVKTLYLVAISIDQAVTEKYTQLLRSSGIAAHCQSVDSMKQLEKTLETENIDIILVASDSKISLHDIFATMQKRSPDTSLVLYGDPPTHHELDYIIRAIIRPDEQRRGPAILLHELHDVTTRRRLKQLEEELRHMRAQCNSLMSSSQDAISYIHAGMHLRVNDAYRELFAIPDEEEIEAIPVMDLVDSDSRPELKRFLRLAERSPQPMVMEADCISQSGEHFPATLEFSHVTIENESCTQLIVRRKQESVLGDISAPIAKKDTETLVSAVEKSLAQLSEPHAILYLGLKNFLNITDTAGILGAEALLDEAAALLKETVANNGIIDRLGESGFIITQSCGSAGAETLANALLDTMNNHAFRNEGEFIHPSTCIGIVATDKISGGAQSLIDDAYQAYLSTNDNQPIVHFDDSKQQAKISDIESVAIDDLIGQAITRGNISTKWQGMINTKNAGNIVSYHVCPRLFDNDGEELSSKEIEKLLEESERSTLFDHMLLKHVIQQLNPPESHFKNRAFVELSYGSVKDANFGKRLKQMLEVGNHSTKQLVCLFSKKITSHHPADVRTAALALKEYGILTYISDYPGNENDLEIIQSLPVEGVLWSFQPSNKEDTSNRSKQKAIIQEMQRLQDAGFRSILPNIETAEELARNWGLGIDYLMGPFIHEASNKPDFDASQYQ